MNISSAPWTPRLVAGNPLAVAVEMEQLILANMVLHDLVIFNGDVDETRLTWISVLSRYPIPRMVTSLGDPRAPV